MRVKIDGREIELKDGSAVNDLFHTAAYKYNGDHVFAVIKGVKREEIETREYAIKTSRGEIRIELIPDAGAVWSDYYSSFGGSKVHWSDKDVVAFGPVPLKILPERKETEFDRYDVLFGSAGYSAKNSYLIFSKERHRASHGSPKEPVFAKVIAGKGILNALGVGDRIDEIKPSLEVEELSNSLVSEDIYLKLDDGDEVLTHLNIRLREDSPKGSEHFFLATEDDRIEIKDAGDTYVANDDFAGEETPFEVFGPRKRGTITVRTTGKGEGKIFIYKRDRGSSKMHSLVGNVKEGMKLLEAVRKGDVVRIDTGVKRFSLIGKSVEDARGFCADKNIKLVPISGQDEDIIVEQNPEETFEILKRGSVDVKTIPKDRLAKVLLYDAKAPKTLNLFRKEIGMRYRPIGKLEVYFQYKNMWLFKPYLEGSILPENKPSKVVRGGEIGITNQAAKSTGLIGIKLEEDERYGPSGEGFKATNIIGRLIDLEKLGALKEGDYLYTREVRSDE